MMAGSSKRLISSPQSSAPSPQSPAWGEGPLGAAYSGVKAFDLVVYRRAVELADDLHRLVARWPPFDRWTIGVQLVRAAHSIGANLAEASGRWGYGDQRRFLYVARGSQVELEHWLERAEAQRLELPVDAGGHAAEIGRMLNGLIRALPPH
jgi:four helix bundle protein